MAYSKSPLAYEDLREIFDRALDAPKGLRIPCKSRGAAMQLRSRFNSLREVDRKQNLRTYAEGDPMHGQSQYDRLTLRIMPPGDPNDHYLYILHRLASELTVEEIE
jgi:hypothetical protein